MFINILGHARSHAYSFIRFIWHGGEPFLIRPNYYRDIARIQQEIFGGRMDVVNTVQTNLTVLTPDMLAFIEEEKFFEGIGVSFDPFGGDRVDKAGRSKDHVVIKNLQTLIDRKIPCGAITVLTCDTRKSAVDSFGVYDYLNISHRFLPFYMSADAAQAAAHSLTFDEMTSAYCDLVDAWLQSKNAPSVQPIDEYFAFARRVLRRTPKYHFDPCTDEFVFIVDVNGDIWGVMGAYDPDLRYGNIFEERMEIALQSENRRTQIKSIERRLRTHCSDCEYYGYCPGKYIATATKEERRVLDENSCVVREVITHALYRLNETQLAS
jgi:uncharacterized protein